MRPRIIAVLVAVVAALAAPTAAVADAQQDRFIENAGEQARPSQERYGVPASVSVAQAILESGWGGSDLAREDSNYFGMKCKGGDPGPIASGCVERPTKECDSSGCWSTRASFRSYDTVADSFSDHGHHLSTQERYAAAFDHTDDPDRFIAEVHKAGYATDPKYTEKIVSLMQRYDLYRFDASAEI